ncbi:hypothetical protein EJ06DRAFT_44614 [Trichodelitschia bisporula]|uniref:Uncharacterized protein n=1 Tax=Trichodelitschia bisporula TaxID=703511 RepID=A0A6G1HVH4_9PEZI|nr:hypothetical protein EJ06DRAFT_44614 [Trichodelitschia bisporula]
MAISKFSCATSSSTTTSDAELPLRPLYACALPPPPSLHLSCRPPARSPRDPTNHCTMSWERGGVSVSFEIFVWGYFTMMDSCCFFAGVCMARWLLCHTGSMGEGDLSDGVRDAGWGSGWRLLSAECALPFPFVARVCLGLAEVVFPFIVLPPGGWGQDGEGGSHDIEYKSWSSTTASRFRVVS